MVASARMALCMSRKLMSSGSMVHCEALFGGWFTGSTASKERASTGCVYRPFRLVRGETRSGVVVDMAFGGGRASERTARRKV